MQDPVEMPPSIPVSDVPALPADPNAPKPRRNFAGMVIGLAAVVIIATAFGTLLFIRQHPTGSSVPQASAILSGAAAANLRDTQFAIAITAGTSGAVSGSTSAFSFTIKGNGALTTSPNRLHLVLTTHDQYLGNVTVEEIATSDALYIKEPNPPGQPHPQKTWQEVKGLSKDASGANFTDFLNYHLLKNPQYLGEATINGRKTWHIRGNLTGGLANGEAATATAVAKQLGITTTVATEDFWIREDTMFPAQLTYHYSVTIPNAATTPGSNSTTGDSGKTVTTDMTLNFTSWNTGITIKLPPANQVIVITIKPIPAPPGKFFFDDAF